MPDRALCIDHGVDIPERRLDETISSLLSGIVAVSSVLPLLACQHHTRFSSSQEVDPATRAVGATREFLVSEPSIRSRQVFRLRSDALLNLLAARNYVIFDGADDARGTGTPDHAGDEVLYARLQATAPAVTQECEGGFERPPGGQRVGDGMDGTQR
ncbi:hypothetical protein PG985_003625 [Apiospora marii]|uniref:Uncharacterized protein n=1 Tax=Apiospora marii TaxID=335849 RepID=A0ABR1SJ96_9PEZI